MKSILIIATITRTSLIISFWIIVRASNMNHKGVLAVKYKLTLDNIIDMVHVFPTMSEAIKLTAQSFKQDIRKMSCCID